VKRLLLVGGGHSHIEVLRRFAATPVPGTEVVLVSRGRYLLYTGMLPGLIAGHYRLEECRIDLEGLARAAGVRFMEAEAAALDLPRGELRCGAEKIAFDLLSLDVGAVPEGRAGASLRAVPVKPFEHLLAAWQQILAAARDAPQDVVVVGGGAGGVELALAMSHGLQAAAITGTRIAVATESPLLAGHPDAAGRKFDILLARSGIRVHRGRVAGFDGRVLRFENGEQLPAGWTVRATSAVAPGWLAASGLAADARGFVVVDPTLRSISHPNVYATGDCASLLGRPLPKSGVYAVRQGPPLAANLRNALTGARLLRYSPQRRALALIGTGGRHAVATWGGITLSGAWAWSWKESIDRRFVAKYRT
jgi:selenide,water dikinase